MDDYSNGGALESKGFYVMVVHLHQSRIRLFLRMKRSNVCFQFEIVFVKTAWRSDKTSKNPIHRSKRKTKEREREDWPDSAILNTCEKCIYPLMGRTTASTKSYFKVHYTHHSLVSNSKSNDVCACFVLTLPIGSIRIRLIIEIDALLFFFFSSIDFDDQHRRRSFIQHSKAISNECHQSFEHVVMSVIFDTIRILAKECVFVVQVVH